MRSAMTRGTPGKRLPDETIEQIRRLLADGLTVAVIADRLRISKSMVRLVASEQQQPTAEDLADLIWPDENPEPS